MGAFEDLFEKVSEEDINFNTLVKCKIYDDVDIYESQANIVWRLDMEYRSWGVKDINIAIVKPIEVIYSHDDKKKSLILNPEDISIEMIRDLGIYPQELSIKIDNDKVKEALITFVVGF